MKAEASGMKMLVLTLASGEAGLPRLREQLARQSFRADHVVIEGLANREAHATLYKMVMERARDYDLFFKIDADMSFARDTALADVVKGTEAYPAVRHFLFPIYDCFTEQEIRGVSLFRSGVAWGPCVDGLFVDPAPIDARATWCGGSAMPFIKHGEFVSDFECFSFGVHKLIKVMQRDRADKKTSKQSGRLLDLARLRSLCRDKPAPRHWQAMRGVVWALHNRAYQAMDSKAELRARFERMDAAGPRADADTQRLVHSDIAWWRALAAELGGLQTLRALVQRPPAEKPRTIRIDLPI